MCSRVQLQHGRDINGLAEIAFDRLERIVEIGSRENAGDALLDQSGRSGHFQHDHQRTTGTAVSYAVPVERAAQRQHQERVVLRRSGRAEGNNNNVIKINVIAQHFGFH